MTPYSREQIANAALVQFRDEQFNAAVEAEKARLRKPNPSIWQRLVNLLPFTITRKK